MAEVFQQDSGSLLCPSSDIVPTDPQSVAETVDSGVATVPVVNQHTDTHFLFSDLKTYILKKATVTMLPRKHNLYLHFLFSFLIQSPTFIPRAFSRQRPWNPFFSTPISSRSSTAFLTTPSLCLSFQDPQPLLGKQVSNHNTPSSSPNQMLQFHSQIFSLPPAMSSSPSLTLFPRNHTDHLLHGPHQGPPVT